MGFVLSRGGDAIAKFPLGNWREVVTRVASLPPLLRGVSPGLIAALLPPSEDREEVMPLDPPSCDRVDERWLLPTPCGRKAVPASPVMGLLELLPTSSDRGNLPISSTI